MEKHQGYTTTSNGAKCSECEEWMDNNEECVLLEPANVGENGSVSTNATAIHGVLCINCYEDL